MINQHSGLDDMDRPGAIDLESRDRADPPSRLGHRLDLRERIALAGEMSETELVECLCSDQVLAWQAGRRIPAEAYLALHPALRVESVAAFEVVYSEFVLRESAGESPSLEEFTWRFPKLADRLRRQITFHRALASDALEDHEGGATSRSSGGSQSHEEGPAVAGAPRIPGYQVLGELGRGGTGVVYKARQLTLNRLVALKVIQTGHYAFPGAVDRFRAEAEAVARFQHPNIIQIHEVGEHEGLGYLALEYAAGGSLETAIAGTPQEPRKAAALVEELARAIHYAHECGIVHRDLKPANVVMTEDRVSKITDFGLAKLLEQEEGSTVSGTILGTPSYMAPEQLLGFSREITPAADVYALGAILYEVLTGRPPFKEATPLSTLDQVANHEPLAPSKLQRKIPADLETICLKCLEKIPTRRYPTAKAMADDLQRFLDGRPILARPSPIWEKAVKWARRRPGIASALVGVVAAVVVVLGGTLYYNTQLEASVRTARAARVEAERSSGVALEQRTRALEALDKLVFEVQERLGETPETRSLRRSLLDTAIAGLDKIASSAEATPPDLSRAVAHQKLGEIYRQVGRSADATRQLEQAVKLAEQIAIGCHPDAALEDCLSRSHIGLGELYLLANQTDIALKHFRRVVDLAEQSADLPGARRGLVEAYVRLGRAYGYRREFDEARAWFHKARVLAERWRADEPDSAEAAAMLAWSHRKIADIGKLSGDLAAARGDYLKAIEVGRSSLREHPTDRATKSHLAAALNDLAGILYRRRDLAGAGPLNAESEKLFAELAEADPENADTRLFLIHSQYDSARVLRDLGQFSEATATYRRALNSLSRVPKERRSTDSSIDFLQPELLQRDLADCESAPFALGALASLQAKPTREACPLLLTRLRLLTAMDRPTEALDTVEAISSLGADGVENPAALNLAMAECSRILDKLQCAGPIETRRSMLRRRFADRVALPTPPASNTPRP